MQVSIRASCCRSRYPRRRRHTIRRRSAWRSSNKCRTSWPLFRVCNRRAPSTICRSAETSGPSVTMWLAGPLRRRATSLARSIASSVPDTSRPCKSRCSADETLRRVTTITHLPWSSSTKPWRADSGRERIPLAGRSGSTGPDREPVRMTIVGVVKNVRQSDWTGEPDHEVYLPYLQRPNAFGLTTLTFVVRTTVDPEALAKSCETAVRAIDRSIPLSQVESMQRVIADKLWRSRVSAMLLAVFAAIALALAAVGIYGVISYGVRERTREIGIRVALGGTQLDILRLVTIASLKPVMAGLALGTCVAIAASRLVTALLYQVTATDVPTYLCVILALVFTGIVATCVPAWRAIKADPLIALRHE